MENVVATVLVLVTFLTKQLGENSSTPRDPVAVYDPDGAHADVDFEATGYYCYYWDDNRLVPKKKYGTMEMKLPAWLDPHEWLRNRTAWKWAWGCGCDKTWPEAWQRFLAYDCKDTARRLAAVKLFKTKKFRSDFRRSLREQLETWVATPKDERKFGSPFSMRQWECLTRYERHEARCVDSSLYH